MNTIVVVFDFVNMAPFRTRCTSDNFDANADVLSHLHRAGVVEVEVDTGQNVDVDSSRDFDFDNIFCN